MREIEFRFWFPNLKEMSEPRNLEKLFMDWNSRPKLIALQFTGLEDKNGKKIFEGDILKWAFHDLDAIVKFCGPTYEGGLAEVEYQEFSMAFRLSVTRFVAEPYQGPDTFELWNDPDLWTVEIVGNIYENPELLVRKE